MFQLPRDVLSRGTAPGHSAPGLQWPTGKARRTVRESPFRISDHERGIFHRNAAVCNRSRWCAPDPILNLTTLNYTVRPTRIRELAMPHERSRARRPQRRTGAGRWTPKAARRFGERRERRPHRVWRLNLLGLLYERAPRCVRDATDPREHGNRANCMGPGPPPANSSTIVQRPTRP